MGRITRIVTFSILVCVGLTVGLSRGAERRGLACCDLAGDANNDNTVNIADVTHTIAWLFNGGPDAFCPDEASANGDDRINIADVTYTVAWLFSGGPDPVCGTVTPPPTGGPSSGALIDSAFAAGAIDYETSLIYKIFATYNDSRLPVEYQGDDSNVRESGIQRIITRAWDTLSVATQDIVGPYVVNPVYEGSWANPAPPGARSEAVCLPWKEPCTISPGWTFIDTDNGRGRIWYRAADSTTDRPKAELVKLEFDARIYPDLTDLMSREPDNDGGHVNNGGSDRLDIVLIFDLNVVDDDGSTSSLPGAAASCSDRPPLIQISRYLEGNELVAEVAHQVMHAILMNHPTDCFEGEYDWMIEATATWAEHYVFPDYNTEQEFADDFLRHPDKPLDWNSEEERNYKSGAYLFFLFLQYYRDEFVIPAIWNAATSTSPLVAIELGLGDGGDSFEELWPEFVRRNWNVKPLDDYQQWDGLSESTNADSAKADLTGSSDIELQMDLSELEYLSARYFYYDFTDFNVSSVTFVNGMRYQIEESVSPEGISYFNPIDRSPNETNGLSVQLLYKTVEQDWTVLDVTDESAVIFCRDQRAGRLEEMVVVFSNSRFNQGDNIVTPGKRPFLYLSNTGCWQWEGNVTVVETSCDVNTINSNLTWGSPFGSAPLRLLQPMQEYATLSTALQFFPISGAYNWSVTGSCGGCSISGNQTFAASPPQANVLALYPGAPSGSYNRGVELLGFTPGPTAIGIETHVCPDGAFTQPELIAISVDAKPYAHSVTVSPDGKTISGILTDPSGAVVTFALHAMTE